MKESDYELLFKKLNTLGLRGVVALIKSLKKEVERLRQFETLDSIRRGNYTHISNEPEPEVKIYTTEDGKVSAFQQDVEYTVDNKTSEFEKK